MIWEFVELNSIHTRNKRLAVMLVKSVYLFFVCVTLALNWPCADGGRGPVISSRTRGPYRGGVKSTPSSGWFSWLRGNGASKTPQRVQPPSFRSRIGFSSYGYNYQANFHNSPHFKPKPHPYQSYFQPQTTALFAYHFMPFTPISHVYHHHYYSSGSAGPVYYDYRNSSSLSTSKEPIVYDYRPPAIKDAPSSFEEQDGATRPVDPNDVFIAGVENLLFYGEMRSNQHQVVFMVQDSDGISLESEILSSFDDIQATNSANETSSPYFPDVEFRFDGADEPTDDDLDNIYQMYKKSIDDGVC